MFEAALHRIIGDALLSMQRRGEAEVEFTRALAIARQQQAKSWELRAAMSMARLWRDQGKVQQARELLTPVYGWFTEGFDTRDLMEAKALLEELAASPFLRRAVLNFPGDNRPTPGCIDFIKQRTGRVF